MNRIYLILSLILLLGLGNRAYAQDHNNGYEKIKAAMVTFYTDRMDLNTEQAKKFWPIHNQYETERREIGRQIRNIKKKGNPSELNQLDNLEEKRFELRNKYKKQFLAVISPQQLSQMYQAEEDFRKMIIERKNKD